MCMWNIITGYPIRKPEHTAFWPGATVCAGLQRERTSCNSVTTKNRSRLFGCSRCMSFSHDQICNLCLHCFRLPLVIITQQYYVTCYLSQAFFSCVGKAFSLGLGGARQFPGIVRILTVQGFQPHVFV